LPTLGAADLLGFAAVRQAQLVLVGAIRVHRKPEHPRAVAYCGAAVGSFGGLNVVCESKDRSEQRMACVYANKGSSAITNEFL